MADNARLAGKLFDRRLVSLGLTRAQWLALVHLTRMGASTQAALADVLEVETATIARMIDRLEVAGWIERNPSPTDRRVKLVSVTTKAGAIMDKAAEVGRQLREEMLVDLTEPEQQRLVGALSAVKSRLISLLETQ